MGCSAHHLAHAGAHGIEIRSLAGKQHGLDVRDAPLADAGGIVGRDVRRFLSVGSMRVAGKGMGMVERAQEIARRVAFSAMTDGLDEIGAAINDW